MILPIALGLLVLLVLGCIIVWFFGYLWETHQNKKPGRVIYHGSNLKEQGLLLRGVVQRYLIDQGEQTKDYGLVELGAGLARVSQYLAKSFEWKSVKAVEIGTYIMMLGKLRLVLEGSQVQFIQHDIFTYHIADKSVIYCYLFSELITKLYEQGSLRGHLVISLTFPIGGCTPTEIIQLKSWQNALYIYDFRAEVKVPVPEPEEAPRRVSPIPAITEPA